MVDEIGIGHIAGGCIDPTNIHNSTRTEKDPGRIHDVDLAVGSKGSLDARRVRAGDSVQHSRHVVRLKELNNLIRQDIEAGVIDDAAVTGLDGQLIAVLCETDFAAHHSTIGRTAIGCGISQEDNTYGDGNQHGCGETNNGYIYALCRLEHRIFSLTFLLPEQPVVRGT